MKTIIDELREIKKHINMFLTHISNDFDEPSYVNLYSITDIEIVESNNDSVTIKIVTHRPGVLIGRAGDHINRLRIYVQKEIGKNIEINIEESKLWKNLYK